MRVSSWKFVHGISAAGNLHHSLDPFNARVCQRSLMYGKWDSQTSLLQMTEKESASMLYSSLRKKKSRASSIVHGIFSNIMKMPFQASYLDSHAPSSKIFCVNLPANQNLSTVRMMVYLSYQSQEVIPLIKVTFTKTGWHK